MKTKALAIVTISLLLSACGGTKKVQGPPQPEWVTNRPKSQLYYYGVGAARKTLDVSQFQQAARQNALADMSSEISVSISSNSVIHAFESNLNFNEDFTSTIRAQTQQDLEGYEQVDSWEDLNNYWVYYRLSKLQYQQLKEKRKNDAVTRSLDFFLSGINAREGGDVRLGLVQMVKALEPIKPYFSEPLPVDINGSEVFLGNEIFKEISNTLAQITIVPAKVYISVKAGQAIPSSMLAFDAFFRSSIPIVSLPLEVEYSEKPMRNNKQRTNSNGNASFDIDVVRSKKSLESFTAKIDINDILSEAGTDPLTRRLINRFNLPNGTIRINIEKPIIYITSSETNLGEVIKPGYIEQSIKKKAVEMGYLVKDVLEEADYIIEIIAATSSKGQAGQFKVACLEGTLSLETRNGNQLYHKPLSGFEGRHFELKQAGEEAFKDAKRKVEISYFREMHEAMNRL
ncbi:MAG: LPP20 family lipoprotein [Bacteroidales bacterium]|jgi:hypothetical protein|nr:LPP20 family lipoprotein [Bacteroidales bacterium]MDD4384102.1 LPP20 family lipoprotein [Bacteroidales bacterium]MDY0197207.1 LPP20 family lipoprotein [Tenuifilaceae bacterium]